MRQEAKIMLRDAVIPVLLGNCAQTQLLSLKIFFGCGVRSYVCDIKDSAVTTLNPFARSFRLVESEKDTVFIDSLSYIASNNDYLPILVPCTKEYEAFVEKNLEALEAGFIISDREHVLSDTPLAYLL